MKDLDWLLFIIKKKVFAAVKSEKTGFKFNLAEEQSLITYGDG
jgi:hypothetical protein